MKKPSWYYLLLLILAGEAVFILPFVLPRVFRPTVLEVFEMNNFDYNIGASVYGIVAMVSYLLGGPLADKYPPRKLMAIALWLTAAGGLVYAAYPGLTILKFLYGYWGFTTIFLFWAPMIKAARVWGGGDSQGKAFGLLDGGRGLTGALFGLLGVAIFAFFLTGDADNVSLSESKQAFSYVIYSASCFTAIVGVLVWLFMKTGVDERKITVERISRENIGQVMRLPSVWLLMIIIMCAYVGYKITDAVSQYASEVMLYNQVDAAQVGTLLQFLRPATGIVLGLVADRFNRVNLLLWSFVVTLVGSLIYASGLIAPNTTILFFMSVVILGAGIYAARALYFAVMQEGKIPLVLTGTAVGLISLMGYTPDIFVGPIYGYILDTYSKQEIGFQYVFLMLAAFTFVGGLATMVYLRMYASGQKQKAVKTP